MKIIHDKVDDGAKELDMAELLGLFALDFIGQTGLGYSFNALDGRGSGYASVVKSFTFVPDYSQKYPRCSRP